MKRKSKILCTLILCFSLVFCSNFVSFADTDNSTSLITAFNLPEDYSSSYPYMSSNILKGYAQSNGLPYDLQTDYTNGLFYYINDIQSRNAFSGLKTFITYYTDAQTTIDLSNLPLAVLSSVGGSNYAIYFRFSGSGKIAIVNNYFVSDAAFTIYAYNSPNNDYSINSSDTFRFRTINVDTSDANGLYKITFYNSNVNEYYYFRSCPILFTNLPCYLSSTSGDSGFTASSDLDISDFTFLADNVNYNYLLYNNIVVDPQVPVGPDNPFWEDSKHFLNFKVSSIYGWDTAGTDTVTHNMMFNWNSDMVLNPDFYVLNLVYRIDYKDTSMLNEKSYYYTSPDFTYRKNLEYLAYNTNSGRLVNKYAMELPFSTFYDENNNSFSNDLKASITRMTGTYSPTISSIIDTSNYELDYFWGIVTKQNIANNKKLRGLKNLNVPDVPTNVEVFKITCVLSVGRVANPSPGDVPLGGNVETDYMSGYNVSQFDFLSGNSSVLQDDNTQNLYPSDDENLPSVIEPDEVIPSGNNYSGSVNAHGGNATVNIYNDPMSMWSPNVIKSIKDTFDFIESQLSEYKDNNFMGFMVESYKIIPKPFWDMIILAGGVITGFAVIRFIRNK